MGKKYQSGKKKHGGNEFVSKGRIEEHIELKNTPTLCKDLPIAHNELSAELLEVRPANELPAIIDMKYALNLVFLIKLIRLNFRQEKMPWIGFLITKQEDGI